MLSLEGGLAEEEVLEDLHLTVQMDLVAVQEVSVGVDLVADRHLPTVLQVSVVIAEVATMVDRYDAEQE
jgi:hypothetical protein